MKTPPQFLPLLKQMLGFNRFGPWPLLIYIAGCTATFFFSLPLFPVGWATAHARHGLWSDSDVIGFGVLWFMLAIISTPFAFQMLGGTMSLEFLFTRAIDRRMWLRTGRVAVIIIALTPFLLNLLLSPWAPELRFDFANGDASVKDVQNRYLEAFPGSEFFTGAGLNDGALIVKHGTVMFAAWTIWIGLAGIFLVAAYFTLVFDNWQRRGWHHSKSRLRPILGFIIVNAPAYSIIPLFILCGVLHLNLFEESFLLFALHPIWMVAALVALIAIVQPITERGIQKLEFEFF